MLARGLCEVERGERAAFVGRRALERDLRKLELETHTHYSYLAAYNRAYLVGQILLYHKKPHITGRCQAWLGSDSKPKAVRPAGTTLARLDYLSQGVSAHRLPVL